MYNKIVLLTILSIIMVLATPTVLAQYPANAVYFEPESINETIPYANIMVNTSIDTMSVGMDIYFDPSCVNITDVDFTGTPYSQSTGWTYWGDHVRVGAMNFVGAVSPGTHVVAKLTFECVGSGDCVTDIEFAETELTDDNFDPIDDVSWINGTFTCGTPTTDCLGDCFDATGNLIASNVPCYDCIGIGAGVLWENYPCPVSACGCTCPSMPHEVCPECCDGIDNDGVNGTDWPADPQCGCCIDGDETDGTVPCPPPCVPELPTLALAGLGILGIALLARKRD